MLPGRRSDISVQREGSRSHVGREPFALGAHVGPRPADNAGLEQGAVLTLTCPRCGEGFPSAMQMDPRTFEEIRVANLLERCPECSRVSRFNKPDYLFRAPGESEINLRSGRARRAAVLADRGRRHGACRGKSGARLCLTRRGRGRADRGGAPCPPAPRRSLRSAVGHMVLY